MENVTLAFNIDGIKLDGYDSVPSEVYACQKIKDKHTSLLKQLSF